MIFGLVCVAAVGASAFLSRESANANGRPDARLTNAAASSAVLSGANDEVSGLGSFRSTAYGGSVTQPGPPSGHLAVIGGTAPPVLGGRVNAVASDGRGGWFIGGRFRTVGGVECPRLARVRADGTLDRRWCFAPDSEVWELTITRSRLYVGGEFARIAGRGRSAAAAFNLSTRKLLPWHPRFRTSGCGGGEEEAPGGAMIEQLAATQSTVVVGGCFHTVGGRPRDNFAVVDATTGAPKRWKPRLGDAVGSWALAPSGDTVFLVALWLEPPEDGSHDEVVRQRLVAVDARTAAVKRQYPTPNGWFTGPYPNGGFSIDVSGWTLYLGGEFTRVGAVRRRNLASIDLRSGEVTPWRPDPDRWVDVVAPSGERVYVAGYFTRIGGTRRSGLAAVDRRTGRATRWMPRWRGGSVREIAVSGRARVALGLE
jgi:Domain of unknown function (DUF5122) beta-propeller